MRGERVGDPSVLPRPEVPPPLEGEAREAQWEGIVAQMHHLLDAAESGNAMVHLEDALGLPEEGEALDLDNNDLLAYAMEIKALYVERAKDGLVTAEDAKLIQRLFALARGRDAAPTQSRTREESTAAASTPIEQSPAELTAEQRAAAMKAIHLYLATQAARRHLVDMPPLAHIKAVLPDLKGGNRQQEMTAYVAAQEGIETGTVSGRTEVVSAPQVERDVEESAELGKEDRAATMRAVYLYLATRPARRHLVKMPPLAHIKAILPRLKGERRQKEMKAYVASQENEA